MQWILQIPVLFFSVIVHEFMHGYIAYKKGDDTAYLSGRLTFNPLPHIDLFGTIILPIMSAFSNMPMIGWAKPVPVNQYRMNDPYRDMAIVAFMGPVANFILALISALLLKLFLILGFSPAGLFMPLYYMLTFGVYINLALGFFNLIPVFPLDGSHVLIGFLPYKWLVIYEKHIPYGFYIILFLAVTGLFKYIVIYPMNLALSFFSLIGLGI